ncbi:DNA ligase 1 [Drosophila biarmipes]|uniref:DNA ligase 1 n=1 Tax=Drosophila biarmipes TaxID=125945 RepID=UPI0007E6B2B2|nr:DNA ligase 1 [Drosophila biarmipes]
MPRFGQQLMLLAMACLALQTAHGWFLKLPKLEAKLEKDEAMLDWIEGKKQKELLKKLDFLNLFTEKEEAKLEKKENEWDKFKQWWEEKKEKELAFFEAKKEKELAFFEGKLSKKSGKKSKPKKTTVKPCYGYAPCQHYSEEVTEAAEYEEAESEEVTQKPCPKSYAAKSYDRPTYSVPTIYDVRDDSAEGVRYFT